jgi:PAS domain-containing protein
MEESLGSAAFGYMFMKRKRGIYFSGYIWSVLAVGAASVILTNWPRLLVMHSMAPYMVAVVMIAWCYGLMPSLFAIALSCLSFAYFIAPPAGLRIGFPEDRMRVESFLIIGCLFTFLIAARATAEAKARSMLQRLSLALEGTKVGVWDLTLSSGVLWHSAGLAEVFGRDNQRFAQSYEVFLGYVDTADRDFVHRTVTRSIEGGDGFHIQYRIVLPNGQVKWVGTRGRIFQDDKGRPERLVAVTTDLTNQPGVAMPPGAVATAEREPISTVSIPISPATIVQAAALPT